MSVRWAGLVEGTSAALVGAGVVTLALFPLAIPFIVLTAVALIPILAVGLVLAGIATPLLLVTGWLGRRVGRRGAPSERSRTGPTVQAQPRLGRQA